MPTLNRGQWGGSHRRRRPRLSQRQQLAAVRRLHARPLFHAQPERGADARPLRVADLRSEDAEVWPVRPTRGINRGYRDQVFRPDGSSRILQSAGTPVVYRGDRLPAELRGGVFVTDSTTNMLHWFVIDDDGHGRLTRAQRLREGRDLRLPRRALAAGERYIRARRHALRRGHVPRSGAGRRLPDRVPAGLHPQQQARPARSTAGASGGWCTRRRARDRKPALSKETPARACRVPVPSERLVARHRAAAPGAARRSFGRSGAEGARCARRRTGGRSCTRWGRSAGSTRSTRRPCEPLYDDRRPTCARGPCAGPSHGWPSRVTRWRPPPSASWTTRTGPCAASWRRRSASCPGRRASSRRVAMLQRYGEDPITVDAVVSGLPGWRRRCSAACCRTQGNAEAADAVAMLDRSLGPLAPFRRPCRPCSIRPPTPIARSGSARRCCAAWMPA